MIRGMAARCNCTSRLLLSICTGIKGIQFSGTLVCQHGWRDHLGRLAGTRVYQSHGTFDPVLPFSSAESLRELLSGGEVDVQFHSFEGPHTIDPESVAITAQWLGSLIG